MGEREREKSVIYIYYNDKRSGYRFSIRDSQNRMHDS